MKDKQIYKDWELIHDDERSLVTLVLTSEEGEERLWLTYDELATLKVLLGASPLSPNLPS